MKNLPLLLLFMTALTSCASHDLILKKEKLTPFKQFSRVTKVATDGFSIHVEKFVDKREKRESVGEGITGFFSELTPIQFEDSLESFVLAQMKSGLKERGFSVSSVTGGDFDLKGEIEEFWIEETTVGLGPEEAECRVKMNLALWDRVKSTPLWNGSFRVKLNSGGKMWDGGEKFAPTVASCMNEVLEQLIRKKNFQEATGIRVLN